MGRDDACALALDSVAFPPKSTRKTDRRGFPLSQAPRVCPRSSVVGIDPVDTMLGEISPSTSPPRQVKCSRGGGDRVRGSGAKRPRCSTRYSRTRGSLPSQPAKCPAPHPHSSLSKLLLLTWRWPDRASTWHVGIPIVGELGPAPIPRINLPSDDNMALPDQDAMAGHGWQKGGQLCRHSDVYPRALIGAGRRCDTYPAFYHAHLGLGRAREGLRLPTYPCLDVGVFFLGAVLCCVAALCHAILRASSPGTGLAAMVGGHLDMSGQP